MRATTMKTGWHIVRSLLPAFLILGCSDPGAPGDVILHELVNDTDSETETESDSEDETYSDECPDNYEDDLGRCIRYVNLNSTDTVCGTSWDDAFATIQPAIDSAYAAAQVLGHCEVWVAQGTYHVYESSELESIRLKPLVSVYGGFVGDEHYLDDRDFVNNVTVLDGAEQDGEGHVYHVVMSSSNASLDGFTIRGGRAFGSSPNHRGGGVYINSSSTQLYNCILEDNEAELGGAVFAYDEWPIMTDCTFNANRADKGGAIYVLNGAPQLTNVTFSHNVAQLYGGAIFFERVYGSCYPDLESLTFAGNGAGLEGGAIYNLGCDLALIDVVFDENRAEEIGGAIATFRGALDAAETTFTGNTAMLDGGALYARFTDASVRQSLFEANAAHRNGGAVYLNLTEATIFGSELVANVAGEDGGALMVEYDGPRIVNTLIHGNQAERGGGLFNGTRAEPDVINCVFTGNRAFDDGGGMYDAPLAEPNVFNTIFWADVAKAEIYDAELTDPLVTYCDVRGGYTGDYNIDEDPLFTKDGLWADSGTPEDPSDDVWFPGDYHLDVDSPCIDYATEDVSPEHDADGNPWEDIVDVGMPDISVDMGAYDYQP